MDAKEELIKSWENETDAYLLLALTKNIEDYPAHVQTVIEEQAIKRGLIDDTVGKDNKYNLEPKAVAWEQQINNRARKQFVVGIISTLILVALGILFTVRNADVIGVGLWEFCWWVLFLVIPTVLLAVYAWAMLMRKLRVVRWVGRYPL